MFQRDMQCFMKLAECLSYTAAAEQLYLSQSGLSKIISNLEKDLGVQLFIRNTRNVCLSAGGEQFLTICRGFQRQCEILKGQYSQDTAASPASLRIGMGDMHENRYFPQLVNTFATMAPLCKLSIKRYNPEELLREIETGNVDVGIMTSFAIPEHGFEHLVYYPSPLMLVTCPSHPLSDRDSVRIDELSNENFVFIDHALSCADRTILEICHQGGFQPNIVTETNSLSSMFSLVASGVGVSLNFLLHKEAFNLDLRFIPLELEWDTNPTTGAGAALVWKPECVNPMVPLFIRCGREIHPDALCD